MKCLAFAASLSLFAAGALAQPMRCVDASGKVRYLDAALIGTEKCEPVKEGTNVVAPQPRSPAPRETRRPPSRASQNEAELAQAQERLAQAKKALAEQEEIRTGNERNYARVQERLLPYQEAVSSAEQEVERLKRSPR